MTEERKHAILLAATLLCARELIETIESDKPNLAKPYFVDKAINEAAFILKRIDKRWPEEGVEVVPGLVDRSGSRRSTL